MYFNALRLRGFRVQACQCLEHVLCLGVLKPPRGRNVWSMYSLLRRVPSRVPRKASTGFHYFLRVQGGRCIVGGFGGPSGFCEGFYGLGGFGALGSRFPGLRGLVGLCWGLIEIVASVKPLQPCHVSSHKYYGPNVGLRGFMPVATCVADRGLQIKAGHGLRRKTFCQTSNLSKSRSCTNSLIQIRSMNSRRKTLATERTRERSLLRPKMVFSDPTP